MATSAPETQDASKLYRSAGGALIDRRIPYLARLPKDVGQAKERILQGIQRSKDVWSHPQVAVGKMDLQRLGFEPTRWAIPIPGDHIGATSWRSGELHAHIDKDAPIYLVHRDEAGPSGIGSTLKHLAVDMPKGIAAMIKHRMDPVILHQKTAALRLAFAKMSEAAPAGWYKGQPTPAGTVKFKTEYQGIPISIDRPKGFIMKGTDAKGNDWVRKYKFDYGFIPKTLGGDDDGLDVFIGPEKAAEQAYWVVQRKDDGSFDEYKVFLGFPDRHAAMSAYVQHIPKKFFKGIITMKVEMMKAMLGKVNPDEKMKRASALAFIDELGWLLSHSDPDFLKEAGWVGDRAKGLYRVLAGSPLKSGVIDPKTGKEMLIATKKPFQDLGESLMESGALMKSRPAVAGVHGLPKAPGLGQRIAGGALHGAGESYGAEALINPIGLPAGGAAGGAMKQIQEELGRAGHHRAAKVVGKAAGPTKFLTETAGSALLPSMMGVPAYLAAGKSAAGTAGMELARSAPELLTKLRGVVV